MTPFWFGVVVFLVTSALSLLHNLVTLRGLVERAQSFWFWLPANLSFAFFSGVLWTLLSEQENHLGVGLVSALLIGVNVVLAIVLDARLSVVGAAYRNDDVSSMRVRALVVFAMAVAATAALYSLYAEVDSIAVFWVVAATIALLFWPVWNFLRTIELSESKRRIERLLDFHCETDSEVFRAEPDDVYWSSTSPLGLAHALECVERSYEQIQCFRPLRRNRLVPGLSCRQVSRREISGMADEVRKRYLERLTARRHCLRLLLGSDAVAEDSAHALRKFCDAEATNALQKRRGELRTDPAWTTCAIQEDARVEIVPRSQGRGAT